MDLRPQHLIDKELRLLRRENRDLLFARDKLRGQVLELSNEKGEAVDRRNEVEKQVSSFRNYLDEHIEKWKDSRLNESAYYVHAMTSVRDRMDWCFGARETKKPEEIEMDEADYADEEFTDDHDYGDREMTLHEVINNLPEGHQARAEFEEQQRLLNGVELTIDEMRHKWDPDRDRAVFGIWSKAMRLKSALESFTEPTGEFAIENRGTLSQKRIPVYRVKKGSPPMTGKAMGEFIRDLREIWVGALGETDDCGEREQTLEEFLTDLPQGHQATADYVKLKDDLARARIVITEQQKRIVENCSPIPLLPYAEQMRQRAKLVRARYNVKHYTEPRAGEDLLRDLVEKCEEVVAYICANEGKKVTCNYDGSGLQVKLDRDPKTLEECRRRGEDERSPKGATMPIRKSKGHCGLELRDDPALIAKMVPGYPAGEDERAPKTAKAKWGGKQEYVCGVDTGSQPFELKQINRAPLAPIAGEKRRTLNFSIELDPENDEAESLVARVLDNNKHDKLKAAIVRVAHESLRLEELSKQHEAAEENANHAVAQSKLISQLSTLAGIVRRRLPLSSKGFGCSSSEQRALPNLLRGVDDLVKYHESRWIKEA